MACNIGNELKILRICIIHFLSVRMLCGCSHVSVFSWQMFGLSQIGIWDPVGLRKANWVSFPYCFP